MGLKQNLENVIEAAKLTRGKIRIGGGLRATESSGAIEALMRLPTGSVPSCSSADPIYPASVLRLDDDLEILLQTLLPVCSRNGQSFPASPWPTRAVWIPAGSWI